MYDTISGQALEQGLRLGQIWPALQPLIHLRSRRVAGFEVLARWSSPSHGEIPPAQFIPVAEAAGLLDALFLHLLHEVATAMGDCADRLILAFNLSPGQFLDPTLLTRTQEALAQTELPMRRLRFEITETTLFTDSEVAHDTLRAFKEAGASLSLDDFGTGHSSLTRLQALPFDEIKIDGSFVRGMGTDRSSFRIVSAVIGLGQSLGLHVLAEGIETEEQATLLTRLGCQFGQGFLLGRPGSIAMAREQLAKLGAWGGGGSGLDNSPFQRWHQLETLYQAAPVGLCFLDEQLRVVSANATLMKLFGFDCSDPSGVHLTQLCSAPEHMALFNLVNAVATGSQPEPSEYHNRANGRTSLVSFQQVRSEFGEFLGITGEAIDITSRVHAERSLQENAEHFRHVIRLSPNIPWAATADGVIDYMGPTFEWEPETTSAQRHERWLNRMDPADRVRVRTEWLAQLGNAQPFSTEFRILWPDSGWRLVRSQAFPQFDTFGMVERWYGLIVDITAERQLEQRITDLEARLDSVTRAERGTPQPGQA
jgi:PAS domain S-box-containing protein